MVDISEKAITKRRAVAKGKITFQPEAFAIFCKQGSPKGNVIETAKIAGVMAAKLTPTIIPLCHPLALDKVNIHIETITAKKTVEITAEVLSTGKTGVEMEALTAVSAAALTIYDMMKWAGQTMVISQIKLLHKSGGKTGVYEHR
ncbi:MAG: cyclic pyranopterin monophosphate synthase MoaC [Candidatus Omnitrophica bacterium]|nr:cyclic pyranopterin monophosphate synthase MoaC [Candidatus Omnitrophota bacterium]